MYDTCSLINVRLIINILLSSTEQEDMFRSLESFIVCLRHCSNEVKKTKGDHTHLPHPHLSIAFSHLGPQCLAYIYLEQFVYLVLVESLLFFSSGDVSGGVPKGVSAFTPTLESSQHQVATATELNNRFVLVCTMAIDWIVHGIQPLTEDHARLFKEGVAIHKYITFDKKVQLVAMTAGFIRFTVQYFYRALQVVIRKVWVTTSWAITTIALEIVHCICTI